ncbi:ATP-binding protein [uncultured Ruthenibacterium sp.]|uniref:ATP-binding protein n=1 Tax=uncultured Ruthenibacterium sp. TaxID=1905347 RepID=UPI00349ECE96
MKMRREHHWTNLVLSGSLLVFVAALLAITIALVRSKLLQNAQDFGMALVQSYAIEEEMNIENLETSVQIASQYVDEIVTDGGDPEQVQQWLEGYFRKLADTIGEGLIDIYAVVDGGIVAANPWEGDDDFDFRQSEWYTEAIQADGELVCGEVYTDAITGEKIFTISVALEGEGNVLAMDVFVQDPQMHTTIHTLPEKFSYYLCDRNGGLLYASTIWEKDAEQLQSFAYYMLAGIEDGSLIDYDSFFNDPNGVPRSLYYYRMENGWTVIITTPVSDILMGETNTLVVFMGAIALGLFLLLAFFTVQDLLHSRSMHIANRTARLLGDSFYAIYRVDLRNESYEAFKLHESMEGVLPARGDYSLLMETMSEVVRPSTFQAVETSFSIENMRQRVHQGIADYGGDFQRKFGNEYRWVNIRSLYNEKLAPDEVILCFRDVDDEKKRGQQHTAVLQAALDTARKSAKDRSEFFSRMSHDMRTPLNAILGCCNLAQRNLEEGDTDQTRDYLGKISFAGNQLLDLVNDILELSRMEAGKGSLDQKPMDLCRLLTDTADLFRDQLREEGKNFEVSIQFEQNEVLGDEKKISQVLNNLLSNAAKYTNPSDTIRLEARQFRFRHNSKYQLIVEDTGIGMSEEFQKHLFDPYSRETAFSAHPVLGSGLGMSIVKILVQQMSGEISVESKLGEGTRFTVTLPFAPAADASAEEKSESTPFCWQGRCVLVAEDNEINREITTALLEQMGARVISADNGARAVQAFLAQPEDAIDVILMDMQMPEMDGCEAARAIRALPRADAADVPIIAVTANVFSEDIDRTTRAGMNGHIPKPVDADTLSKIMQRMISQREQGKKFTRIPKDKTGKEMET